MANRVWTAPPRRLLEQAVELLECLVALEDFHNIDRIPQATG
jgi:hypothetical protein